jgi:hypothetical protein
MLSRIDPFARESLVISVILGTSGLTIHSLFGKQKTIVAASDLEVIIGSCTKHYSLFTLPFLERRKDKKVAQTIDVNELLNRNEELKRNLAYRVAFGLLILLATGLACYKYCHTKGYLQARYILYKILGFKFNS